ncbi:hypothetical protein NQ318_008703 [Aromia moschata]|uniref:Transposase n=1 Tax=Aromia moschata TaxID=1265417 RepID=A0AAV8X5E8_9CUCU|nr:hypothetical protein NQ318_008703 [Aromia moschata]
MTIRILAEDINIGQSTIRCLKKLIEVWKLAGWIAHKFSDNSKVDHIPKSGRKRILDDEQKLDILLDIQDNPHKPTRQVAADNDLRNKSHTVAAAVIRTAGSLQEKPFLNIRYIEKGHSAIKRNATLKND